ncbi:MAG TPA: hypothetical protein VH592_19965 [Gemmataceae bacterium]|jgi:hypothetical protein
MSQAAPSSDKTGKKTASPLVPPDERFWQRYSPHAELPLSSAGSLVVHVLALGLMILLAWIGTVLLNHSSRQLPVEAVQLSGGGGDPNARGRGSDAGSDLVEVGKEPDKSATEDVPAEDIAPPKIDVKPDAAKPKFEDSRPKIQSPEDANKVFQNLRIRAGSMQSSDSKPSSNRGHGKGGTGSGGGSGDGKGPGIGSGVGPGVGTPSQREKRMLRWSMLFNTPNSADYVSQLRGLGAILAVPVREDANGTEYKIIRDLGSRPAKLLDEDFSSIQRLVRWADDNPDSVKGVMTVLQLKLRPSHFLAFMPIELEEKLLKLEIDYLTKRHPSRKEDDIESTKFKILVRNGKYEPMVIEQKMK